MKLQQFIINESINDKGILKSVFMGGTPGAGKSYVLKKITDGNVNPRIVNTDTWTEFLKVGKDSETYHKYSDTTRKLTKEQVVLYINSMLPLWVDGTSANPSNLFKREGLLKSFGYDTAMIWVNTSLETAKARAEKREKLIGRHVDVEVIEDLYRKATDMKNYYKTHFHPYLEINNDDGELTDQVILDAFKKISHFYLDPVKNPVGIELIKDMKENGYKYLVDNPKYSMSDINNAATVWYRHS